MTLAELRLRLLGDLHGRLTESGWASRSVKDALTRSSALVIGVWQFVMIGALVVEPGSVADHGLLLCAHGALAALCTIVFRRRDRAWLIIPSAYTLALWDWGSIASIDSPVTFAACWLINFTHFLLTFVLRGRIGLISPVLVALLLPVLSYAVRPEWGLQIPTAEFATVLAITVSLRLGLSYLFDFAREADIAEEQIHDEARREAVQVSASRKAAEDARILHDTVINTLGAITHGGAAVSDRAAVRKRCAADIATVTALSEGHESLPLDEQGIRQATLTDAIAVHHLGISDEELARWEARQPRPVVDAVGRATAELVRNAAKHSRADDVYVDITREAAGLVVGVRDHGRGSNRERAASDGLTRSVYARIADIGGEVSYSSLDGRGTSVVLTVPTHWPTPGAGGDAAVGLTQADFDRLVARLRVGASFMLAVGLSVVGFFLAAFNHPGELSPEHGMAVVVGLTGGASWWSYQRRGSLGRLARAVLTISAPVAFVLTAAAVDFAHTDVVTWQALGPLGPLLIVIATSSSPRRALLYVLPYVATVGAIVTLVGASDRAGADYASHCVLVAGLIGLVALGCWFSFHVTIEVIAIKAVASQRSLFASRLERFTREAAIEARQRWRDAGLTACLTLLTGMAGDRLDPVDPSVRDACAEEELYLRQLTQLKPEVVQMGHWFGRCLAQARARGAALNVRTGSDDLAAGDAEACGKLLMSAVDAVPRSETITATLFPFRSEMRFTIVAAHPHLVAVTEGWTPPPGSQVHVRTYSDQNIVEVVLPHLDSTSSLTSVGIAHTGKQPHRE